MSLVFFGSSEYSIPCLVSLLKHDYRILVVAAPDRPAGRGLKLTPSPLADFAQKKNLKIIKPDKLDQKTFPPRNDKVSPGFKLGVCCVYGKIIPKLWLNLFSRGIINIHPSLLPKYRGPSPAQAAILNQEKITGVTFIKMDALCDHGPILAQFREKILPQDTAGELYQRLFNFASQKLPQIIKKYLAEKIKPRPQNHSQATFTKMIKKEDGCLSLKEMSKEIDLKRRAYAPWPGIYTKIKIDNQEKRLKILKTHLKEGRLIIDQVQLEGKKPISFSDFLKSEEL
ncbi:MAG: methionyl-tRNA formyltransferase [Candidatus Shapirobacteria bacterium]